MFGKRAKALGVSGARSESSNSLAAPAGAAFDGAPDEAGGADTEVRVACPSASCSAAQRARRGA